MYLKKIIASGFKSFADKVSIELTDGITGIVGPNGSGKSNVVDAIRWVLGEQSVKSLRGDNNMTDVIFSGSKSRNAQNVATVTLVFDNTDKYLKIDYDEVAIKRRVYKDGTNEYFINEERCRLKDITDLFLDTGIAKESFNIISQGKVSEIIVSKPENRRTIFEEAAQVLKYKKRKEEALRKLERTNDNLDRVNDIIKELEVQVEPLRNDRDKALIYQEKSKELENIEGALIVNDITNLNEKYQHHKEQIKALETEVLSLNTGNNENSTKIEELKLEIIKLDESINEMNQSLILKIKEVEQINSEKNIILERKKYKVDNTKLHNNLIELKEQELKLTNDLNLVRKEIENKLEENQEVAKTQKQTDERLNELKNNKSHLDQELSKSLKEMQILDNKIASLEYSIENSSSLPNAVKQILENPKLTGIIDTIGNLIEVEEKYATSITVALGAATSYIVTENEISATEAIYYLKENKLGRATFFPINVIKSKYIDEYTISSIKTMEGYIGIASNLIKYNPQYKNIIENQLGNIIVVDTIENANRIGKAIKNTYRIITLDGELLHVGGSLTGGTLNKNRNIILEKYELEETLKAKQKLTNEIKEIENKMNDNDYNYKIIEDKIYLINKAKINNNEYISNKNNLILELNEKLSKVKRDISGTNATLNNRLSTEEEKIINEYYKAVDDKNITETELNKLKKLREDKNDKLKETEFSLRRENSLVSSKNKELKDLEIEVNRIDVKLDNLLNKLNESYSMTYEKAKTLYFLDMEEELARNKLNELRRIIKDLGIINLGSIEEFERINERYEFLSSKKTELMNAEDTLLEIIKEMDDVMIESFKTSFETIRGHFQETFKELFKGGHADLTLTDPNNLLETGIEIVASPPGKSLRSISLLSGGEMTFTAISLLFAILKSRPVPFCVLDEVEAALDEVNVDSFGEYLNKFKEKTQFILITHKKKTMEYADVLYGITMQESGVSKLVSVRLEEIK